MFILIRILRKIYSYRRRIFGKAVPHWFRDGMSIVSYVNVLELIPTVAMTFLAPHHFYRRLPQYILNKNAWFKTPIKFFTSSMTLILAFLFWNDKDLFISYGIDEKYAFKLLVIICALVPFAIPVICLIIRIILLATPTGSVPSIVTTNLLIPMLPSTYARLSPKDFLWASFYYGVYFYLIIQILQIIGFLEADLIDYTLSNSDNCLVKLSRLDPDGVASIFERQQYLEVCRSAYNGGDSSMKSYIVLSFLTLFAICSYVLLINPYLWLLRSSIKIPTKRMHLGDARDIDGAVSLFVTQIKKSAGKQDWTRAVFQMDRMERIVSQWERTIILQDRRASRFRAGMLDRLRDERSKIYVRNIKVGEIGRLDIENKFPDEVKVRLDTLSNRINRVLSWGELEYTANRKFLYQQHP